ncbi:MAG: hypothetical protein JWO06_1792 [Bacteroidota bacterium]|nr:hypothetical protein [Bacteroidota bacterium]
MKNKIYISVLAATAITCLFILSACHHSKDTPAAGQFGLHLHTQIDTNEVDLGTFYGEPHSTLWKAMSLNYAQFYISGVSLQKTDGTWYDIPGSMVLKRYELEEYYVASVPSGNYTSVRFYVGLDSATNATNPSQHNSSADSILAATESFMYFGAGQGYKFMSLSGAIRLGTTDSIPFDYQIGGNSNRPLITMPLKNFTVLPNQIEYSHIWCDYGRLLEGITINGSTNNIGNSYGTAPQINTATLVADSIQNMFYYEPGE